MTEYGITHIIHLLCACAFIGVVFFEVFILEGIRENLGPAVMPNIEEGIITRAKKIMPWVVATLFLSGIYLGYTHLSKLSSPFATSFSTLLTIKIALALSVLVHFVTAIRSATNGCMTSKRFERTHLSVIIHMLFIVILAKLMFYVQW